MICVPKSKIILPHALRDARTNFLYDFAKTNPHSEEIGSVAECGVFRGHFASHLNVCFSGRKLYLFDTFEGFHTRDIEYEKQAVDEFQKEYSFVCMPANDGLSLAIIPQRITT
jgi:hypothetical protein